MLSTRNEGKVKGDSGQIKTSSRSNLLSGLVTLALGIDKRESETETDIYFVAKHHKVISKWSVLLSF